MEDERKIENSDWSFLERTAGVAVGGTLAAIGAVGVMTGLSALQSAVSGVGVKTDERKILGTNTHKLAKLGVFERVGSLLPATGPLLGGLLLMGGGTVLVDYSVYRKCRNIYWYTRRDLEGNEPKDIESNTQFHSEKELSDIRLDELDLPDDFTEYLAVEGYEFASDLPELNEATLARKIDITADQANELNKAVVMEL